MDLLLQSNGKISSLLAFSCQPSESSFSFMPHWSLSNQWATSHPSQVWRVVYWVVFFFFLLLEMKSAKQNLRVAGRCCFPDRQVAINQLLSLIGLLLLTDVLFKVLWLLGLALHRSWCRPLEKFCSWCMVGSSVAVADSCSGLCLLWVKKIKLPSYLSAVQAYQFKKWTITFLLFLPRAPLKKERQQCARLVILKMPSEIQTTLTIFFTIFSSWTRHWSFPWACSYSTCNKTHCVHCCA